MPCARWRLTEVSGSVRHTRHFSSAWPWFCLLGLALMGLSAAPAAWGAGGASAPEIESVLLFNLSRFVDWPNLAFADTNAPFVIGILGRDPFGEALQHVVAGEIVNGRRVMVQHCSTPEEAAHCQIVFISSSEKGRARILVGGLKGHPVLTVSDAENFTGKDGGMIAFYVNAEKKIRVRINLEAARAEELNISSKLLHVAELEKSRSSMPSFGNAFAGLRQTLSPLSRTLDHLLRGRLIGTTGMDEVFFD